ncbi:magnesium transporter MRS2-3-like isoform X1 [Alnus glutinosa]|uniref:magnesium transporter MRS2-3-like isoform X1 n=1 Tax=Alnus glutinosa TaxID=3517 RepID=UPI002D798B85|nr:magnesium transporter MRS2-3-like isoform X1 [Alnus glutinosa]
MRERDTEEMEMMSGYSPQKSRSSSSSIGDSPEQARATSTGQRKKVTRIRAWMLVDQMGRAQVLEAGKHSIMRRTGLPRRDLRILDPLLSYPSTILGRERAIVINLENIKAIITGKEVLLLNSNDPSVTPFVEELQKLLERHHQVTRAQGQNGDGSNRMDLYELEKLQSRAGSSQTFSKIFSKFKDQDESCKVEGKHDVESQDGSKILPFEFVALEACLEAACSGLESDASTLEQEANLALDKLTSVITTLNLERVRQIKSRLVAITGRVQKVRDELEHLLDDDDDMAEMYLTEKLVQKHLESSSASSMSETDDIVDEGSQSDMDDRMDAEISLEAKGCSTSYEAGTQNHDNYPHGKHTSTVPSGVDEKNLDVKELEMILEPYFVQVDGTLNKLSTLREYVDDTEDYINIMLDDKQNQLLQMGVMLTAATLVISTFIVIASVLGMNIHIPLFTNPNMTTGMKNFLWTVGGGTTGMIFFYVFAIAYYKRKKLL